MAKIVHNIHETTCNTAVSHSCMVIDVTEKTARIIAVGTDVIIDGFWLSRTVGTKDNANIAVPTLNTKSCQIIKSR